jgi:outer membrane lipase/esterase
MRKFMLTAIAVVGISGAYPAHAATTFSNLFVFGDSLVDSGNARAARLAGGGADPAPPELGYFQGRFSNGYNFADYVSLDLFGRPTAAAAFGGMNFAVGGAQAAEVAGDASPSFAEQLALFAVSGQSLRSDSLVLVTFGGNDVRSQLAAATTPGTVPTLVPAINAFNANLAALVGLGARNIVVTGLPDIGQIPGVTQLGSPALSGLGTQLSFGLNQAINQSVTGLGTQTGYNLQFFDLFAYQASIYSDPASVGLPTSLEGHAPACRCPVQRRVVMGSFTSTRSTLRRRYFGLPPPGSPLRWHQSPSLAHGQ